MLRSGGVAAWLQLLGVPGKLLSVSKSFRKNPASCPRGQRRRGGQMLGALENFALGVIDKVNDCRKC
jgi:hypothetical protein